MFDQMFQLDEKPYSDDDAEWDEFVRNHPQGSLLQTTNWARLKGRFGWKTFRVWLKKEGKLVAGAQVLVKSWGWGIVKIGYIPHGPLVNWGNDEQVDVLLNQIDQAAYQHRVGILKIEPHLWHSVFPADHWEALCEKHGLLSNSDTIQPPRTVQVDLRGSEDEILARMKSKTRYNIRLSKRKGVVVREGVLADMPAFNRIMQTTGQRNAFGVHDPHYYHAAFELFAPDNCALMIAEYEGKPLAGIMVFAHGKQASYLYGASGNEERNRMPAYAVQWAAMKWARDKGCTIYDLWGVPDADADELEAHFKERNDGLWGVYRHKRGYGGKVRRTVGCADRVYNQRLYKLYQWRKGE